MKYQFSWPQVAMFGIAVTGLVVALIFAPQEKIGIIVDLLERMPWQTIVGLLVTAGAGSALAFGPGMVRRREDGRPTSLPPPPDREETRRTNRDGHASLAALLLVLGLFVLASIACLAGCGGGGMATALSVANGARHTVCFLCEKLEQTGACGRPDAGPDGGAP